MARKSLGTETLGFSEHERLDGPLSYLHVMFIIITRIGIMQSLRTKVGIIKHALRSTAHNKIHNLGLNLLNNHTWG